MKIKLSVILFLLPYLIFPQSIKVLDDSKDKLADTKIIFETDGQHIPIYRPLGTLEFSTDKNDINLKKIEFITDAPASLLLNPGFYTFQLYEDGSKFDIDAKGGTQVWKLHAKKPPLYVTGIITLAVGIITSIPFTAYGGYCLGADIATPEQKTSGLPFLLTGIGIAAATITTGTLLLVNGLPHAELTQSY